MDIFALTRCSSEEKTLMGLTRSGLLLMADVMFVDVVFVVVKVGEGG